MGNEPSGNRANNNNIMGFKTVSNTNIMGFKTVSNTGVTVKADYGTKAFNQYKDPICWSHAVASTVRAAEIENGKHPESHMKIVRRLVKKHGNCSQYTPDILSGECSNRGLKCCEVTERTAILLVQQKSVICARMCIESDLWGTFCHFFRNGKHIFTKQKSNDESKARHAVCITGVNKNGGYWYIKNSFGDKWADDGYCRVAFDAVEFRYYQVY
eukprot:348843_1